MKHMNCKTVYPDGYKNTDTADFNRVYSQSYRNESLKHIIEFNKRLPITDTISDMYVTVKVEQLQQQDPTYQINKILEQASLYGCRLEVENLAKNIIDNIKYVSEYVDWYTKVDAYKDSFKTHVP